MRLLIYRLEADAHVMVPGTAFFTGSSKCCIMKEIPLSFHFNPIETFIFESYDTQKRRKAIALVLEEKLTPSIIPHEPFGSGFGNTSIFIPPVICPNHHTLPPPLKSYHKTITQKALQSPFLFSLWSWIPPRSPNRKRFRLKSSPPAAMPFALAFARGKCLSKRIE